MSIWSTVHWKCTRRRWWRSLAAAAAGRGEGCRQGQVLLQLGARVAHHTPPSYPSPTPHSPPSFHSPPSWSSPTPPSPPSCPSLSPCSFLTLPSSNLFLSLAILFFKSSFFFLSFFYISSSFSETFSISQPSFLSLSCPFQSICLLLPHPLHPFLSSFSPLCLSFLFSLVPSFPLLILPLCSLMYVAFLFLFLNSILLPSFWNWPAQRREDQRMVFVPLCGSLPSPLWRWWAGEIQPPVTAKMSTSTKLRSRCGSQPPQELLVELKHLGGGRVKYHPSLTAKTCQKVVSCGQGTLRKCPL